SKIMILLFILHNYVGITVKNLLNFFNVLKNIVFIFGFCLKFIIKSERKISAHLQNFIRNTNSTCSMNAGTVVLGIKNIVTNKLQVSSLYHVLKAYRYIANSIISKGCS